MTEHDITKTQWGKLHLIRRIGKNTFEHAEYDGKHWKDFNGKLIDDVEQWNYLPAIENYFTWLTMKEENIGTHDISVDQKIRDVKCACYFTSLNTGNTFTMSGEYDRYVLLFIHMAIDFDRLESEHNYIGQPFKQYEYSQPMTYSMLQSLFYERNIKTYIKVFLEKSW